MRSQQVVRAAWRVASSCSGSQSRLVASTVSNATSKQLLPALLQTRPILVSQTFSTSSSALKKKGKKALASEVEEFDDDEGDLFADGSISTEEAPLADDGVPAANETGAQLNKATSEKRQGHQKREERRKLRFTEGIEDWRKKLEWKAIDEGDRPLLSAWRGLVLTAKTQEEFAELLELAELYRERIGPLGQRQSAAFAMATSRRGVPELALHACATRYMTGLEYTPAVLTSIQSGLFMKLSTAGSERLLAGAKLPGAPVPKADIFGATSEPTETTEATSKLEVAKAKMTLVDRMCMTASLATPLIPSKASDPVLLAPITAGMINAFKLLTPSAASDPLISGVKERLHDLIRLLFSVLHSTPVERNATDLAQEDVVLRKQLVTTLHYVVTQDPQLEFKHSVTGKKLHPVGLVYDFLENIAPGQVGDLNEQIKPLLPVHEEPQD